MKNKTIHTTTSDGKHTKTIIVGVPDKPDGGVMKGEVIVINSETCANPNGCEGPDCEGCQDFIRQSQPTAGQEVLIETGDSAWHFYYVLEKLLRATDILLHEKDYDGHGWEEVEHCYKLGEKIRREIANKTILKSTLPAVDEGEIEEEILNYAAGTWDNGGTLRADEVDVKGLSAAIASLLTNQKQK